MQKILVGFISNLQAGRYSTDTALFLEIFINVLEGLYDKKRLFGRGVFSTTKIISEENLPERE